MMNICITAAICAILYPYLYYGLEKLVSDIVYVAKYAIYIAAKAYIKIVKWWRELW